MVFLLLVKGWTIKKVRNSVARWGIVLLQLSVEKFINGGEKFNSCILHVKFDLNWIYLVITAQYFYFYFTISSLALKKELSVHSLGFFFGFFNDWPNFWGHISLFWHFQGHGVWNFMQKYSLWSLNGFERFLNTSEDHRQSWSNWGGLLVHDCIFPRSSLRFEN